MKLLILTQKVDINDDLLGFFHGWVREFSRHCEQVIVICLYKGEYKLPGNVKVLSLGKEKIRNLKLPASVDADREIWKKLKHIIRFYKLIWRERKNYDKVFVHMNREYVALGGVLWKAWRKKVGLWYVHRAIDLKLKIAEKLADNIFTASPESFPLKSKKVGVVGHGIDVEKFRSKKLPSVATPFAEATEVKKAMASKEVRSNSDVFKILYVGRISRIKNQELLIKAIDIINADQTRIYDPVNSLRSYGAGVDSTRSKIRVDLVGGVIYEEDKMYLEKLKSLVKERGLADYINFVGKVSHERMVNYYHQTDLSVNLCPTGGVDKAVLESMACGVPVIVLNKTFVKILGDYNNELILNDASEKELAGKIKRVMELPPEKRSEVGQELRHIVVRDHGLGSLIKRIISHYN